MTSFQFQGYFNPRGLRKSCDLDMCVFFLTSGEMKIRGLRVSFKELACRLYTFEKQKVVTSTINFFMTEVRIIYKIKSMDWFSHDRDLLYERVNYS